MLACGTGMGKIYGFSNERAVELDTGMQDAGGGNDEFRGFFPTEFSEGWEIEVKGIVGSPGGI